MNVIEVAEFIEWKPETIIDAIEKGIVLPKSKINVKLQASEINGEYHISDENLESFYRKFEEEDSSRYIPIPIRRNLLMEANYRCGICQSVLPLHIHHIIEYSEIHHHDPNYMIAICPNCHALCGNGTIPISTQKEYKKRLINIHRSAGTTPSNNSFIFEWFDLEEIIGAMFEYLENYDSSTDRRDFSSIKLDKKNKLNNLGKDYFEIMKTVHEPSFYKIDEFIKNPSNKKIVDQYYGIIAELQTKIAAKQSNFDSFEDIIIDIFDQFIEHSSSRLGKKKQVVQILLSYMYFNCDIGRKV